MDLEAIQPYLITFFVSFIIWYYLNGGFKTPPSPQPDEPSEPPTLNNFTLAKLSTFDGSTDETVPNPTPVPIYVSVDSVVFDVSSGRDFYGPGGAYSMFAGKEIGWALATMSFEEVYLGNLDTTGMSVAERSSMEEWIVKYRDYKGYPIVGRVVPQSPPPSSTTSVIPPSEMQKYDGTQAPETEGEIPPIYVGVGDYVFDCSYGGREFYLPGKSYALFAGRDASVALAKMSFKEEDLGEKDLGGLGEKERKVLSDWVKTFRDKKGYPILSASLLLFSSSLPTMNPTLFLTLLFLLALLTPSSAGLFNKKKKEKKDAEAANDVMLGMQGMQQAMNDPAALAQLMRDMQDPELMAEAKKMMESKEFKRQMRKLEKDPNFKKAMSQTAAAFEDPQTAGMLNAQASAMMREGSKQLDSMGSDVQAALAQMEANPAVMKEMQQLMGDPEAMREVMNDPQVKAYMREVEEAMKDPEMRKKMEGVANQFKQQL
ncbi:hypothetical protein TrRE_jg3848 [Triparma retinervis]|uniref:Cytochrome b5 heme-binding domain-containing protein n=1 Tax=Triparma retinervis TaxID=2557542 RepID=A0A9W7CGC8_9STRA|nr:hypothetical protein TrRE_jg3848 [Triparma retinervis]